MQALPAPEALPTHEEAEEVMMHDADLENIGKGGPRGQHDEDDEDEGRGGQRVQCAQQ